MNSLDLDNWIILYIFFEINLIKNLCYYTNLSQYKLNNNSEETKKIKIDGYIYEVPNYLILKKTPEVVSKNLIRKSLYFTRHIIMNRFFVPNNIPFPKSRVILENYFN